MNRIDDLGEALADLAARADDSRQQDRLDGIHARARRTARTRIVATTLAAVIVAGGAAALITRGHNEAGATGPATQSTVPTPGPTTPGPTPTPSTPAHTPTPQATGTSSGLRSGPSPCLTSELSLQMGAGQGAAGSVYTPIVLTNISSHPCTLYGYPGVAFVAPGSGHQVGAAAARNPQHSPSTVTLAPRASASELLQVVDYMNFPPAGCQAMPVSGLRVYPPGNTSAAYIPFAGPTTACSTQISQLTVEATVIGSTGQ